MRIDDGIRGRHNAIVGTGPHAKVQGKHLESGKGNELESPLELPEKKYNPANTLILFF